MQVVRRKKICNVDFGSVVYIENPDHPKSQDNYYLVLDDVQCSELPDNDDVVFTARISDGVVFAFDCDLLVNVVNCDLVVND